MDDSPVGSFGPLGAPGDSISQSHLRSSVPTFRGMERAFEARKSAWGPLVGNPLCVVAFLIVRKCAPICTNWITGGLF